MFGLPSLDVLIGLITIYLALALACTALVEKIAFLTDLRSNNLEKGLAQLLAGDLAPGKKFVDAFYKHPLIQALSKCTVGRPSYIPPEIVAQVVQSLVTANDPTISIKQAIDKLPDTVHGTANNRVKELLATLVTQTTDDAAAFRKAVEKHFDATMDRTSGWVRSRQQWCAVAVSIVLVVAANADTFALVSTLSSNPDTRMKIVELAEHQLDQHQASATVDMPMAQSDYDNAIRTLQSGALALGWKSLPLNSWQWFAKAMGLAVSALAVSLGAPFWFDILQRFMQVRQTGISPREKKK